MQSPLKVGIPKSLEGRKDGKELSITAPVCVVIQHLLIHRNPTMYMSTLQAICLLQFRVDTNWPLSGLEGRFPLQNYLSGSGKKLRKYTGSLGKQYCRGKLQSLSLNIHIRESYKGSSFGLLFAAAVSHSIKIISICDFT